MQYFPGIYITNRYTPAGLHLSQKITTDNNKIRLAWTNQRRYFANANEDDESDFVYSKWIKKDFRHVDKQENQGVIYAEGPPLQENENEKKQRFLKEIRRLILRNHFLKKSQPQDDWLRQSRVLLYVVVGSFFLIMFFLYTFIWHILISHAVKMSKFWMQIGSYLWTFTNSPFFWIFIITVFGSILWAWWNICNMLKKEIVLAYERSQKMENLIQTTRKIGDIEKLYKKLADQNAILEHDAKMLHSNKKWRTWWLENPTLFFWICGLFLCFAFLVLNIIWYSISPQIMFTFWKSVYFAFKY